MELKKPLLSASLEDDMTLADLKYPLLASPKLDGIRVLIDGGTAVSRNLKAIRNKFVQQEIGQTIHHGKDGEIIVGDPTDPMCYRKTNSGVMSEDGEPDFTYYVFDDFTTGDTLGFHDRWKSLNAFGNPRIKILPQVLIENAEQLEVFEQTLLDLGYEGAIVRSLDGKYKQGRSTLKEGIIIKLKRFVEAEAVIVGYKERMHNANEAKTNALGHTERSMHKENMVGRGDMGALLLRSTFHVGKDRLEEYKKDTDLDIEEIGYDPVTQKVIAKITFPVGTGFDDNQRADFWNNKEKYLGSMATYKHFPVGGYDLPRHPVYKDIRKDL